MDDLSHIINGRMFHSLDGWTAAGGAVYSAGNGDAHYGVASLPAASSIRQQLAVDKARAYTLHIAVYGGNATIVVTRTMKNAAVSLTSLS